MLNCVFKKYFTTTAVFQVTTKHKKQQFMCYNLVNFDENAQAEKLRMQIDFGSTLSPQIFLFFSTSKSYRLSDGQNQTLWKLGGLLKSTIKNSKCHFHREKRFEVSFSSEYEPNLSTLKVKKCTNNQIIKKYSKHFFKIYLKK